METKLEEIKPFVWGAILLLGVDINAQATLSALMHVMGVFLICPIVWFILVCGARFTDCLHVIANILKRRDAMTR